MVVFPQQAETFGSFIARRRDRLYQTNGRPAIAVLGGAPRVRVVDRRALRVRQAAVPHRGAYGRIDAFRHGLAVEGMARRWQSSARLPQGGSSLERTWAFARELVDLALEVILV